MAFDFKDVLKKEKIREKGVWRPLYIEGTLVGEVLISAVGTPSFLEAMEKETKSYRQRRSISPKRELGVVQQLEILTETIAKHALHDWRGVDGEDFPVMDGKVLPCTLENKQFLLSMTTFREAISGIANELSDLSLDEIEVDQKN